MSLEIQDAAVVEEVVGIPAGEDAPFADSVPVKVPQVAEFIVSRVEGGYLIRAHYIDGQRRDVIRSTDAKLLKLIKGMLKE